MKEGSPTRLKRPTKTQDITLKLPSAHLTSHAPHEFTVHTTALATLKRKADDPQDNPAPKPIPAKKLKTAPKPAPTKSVANKPVTRASARSTTTTASSRAKTASSNPKSAAKPEPPANDKKTKRPAWDYKGRLQDLEEQQQMYNEDRTVIEQSRSKIEELESSQINLLTTVKVKEVENDKMVKEIDQLKDELKTAKRKFNVELEDTQKKLNSQIVELESQLLSSKRQNDRLNTELDLSLKEIANLKSVISNQSMSTIALETENKLLKTKSEENESTIKSQSLKIEELSALVAVLEAKERESETIRRKLHNTIQELKGNIRVFCRVRPLLPNESPDLPKYIQFPENDENGIELIQTVETSSGTKNAKSYPFTFDKVFQPGISQAVVFDEISQLVQSALDGFNVCIFAYGQTGSGKTYTMEGPSQPDPLQMGMIPRAVEQIFVTAESLREKGWIYNMEAQFIEIYNETLRDLLDTDEPGKKKNRDVKHLPNGRTIVTDTVSVAVTSPKEVHNLLKKASHNRAVAATNCNERSSRSHSVFILRLTGRNDLTDENIEGILNLIDLAGSERLSSSGSTGDRLKETQAINKSLSSLGDVIYALANRETHVPYRNSKLTFLLQNSLGGNSKTLMFVNVSPLNLNETLNSLRFATKVNSCQIGTAKKVSRKKEDA